MVKMLILDGPLAGEIRDVGRYPLTAVEPAGDGFVRQVHYQPRKFMLCGRTIVLGTCGNHDRRALEELTFAALASGAAKEAAGPMAKYVCDHQAYDTRCPRGCHGYGEP